MKNILFVMPKFAPGGAEKSLLMLLHALSERKDVNVDLLLFKHEGIFIEQLPVGINIIYPDKSLEVIYSDFSLKNCNTKAGLISTFTRLAGTFFSNIFSENNNHKTQIRWKYFYSKAIHTYPKSYDIACGYLDGECVYYVVDKVNAKCKIGWNQNDYSGLGFDREIDMAYYRKLDKVVTLTDECEKALLTNFPEINEKLEKIPPIVTKSYIVSCAKAFFPEEYVGVTAPIIISVGRLVAQKGFDFAIDAAKNLKEKHINFSWYIIGNGELSNELNHMVAAYGVADQVHLIGERGNPYPYIKNARIFVQPSRFEGKSVILNETKMLCKPIVVTNYQTVVDQIEDSKNGYICDMNAEAIADTIEKLLISEDLCMRVQNQLAKEQFDDKITIASYEKLFGLDK